MSYVLRLGGAQVAIARGWHPDLFGSILKTSFPRNVDQSYAWTNGAYTLGWEADPPLSQVEIDAAAAAAAEAVADDAAEAEAKADAAIQYLRDHTPAEVAQYTRNQIDADGVTTNAQAIAAIKRIETLMVRQNTLLSVLAKRNLR